MLNQHTNQASHSKAVRVRPKERTKGYHASLTTFYSLGKGYFDGFIDEAKFKDLS